MPGQHVPQHPGGAVERRQNGGDEPRRPVLRGEQVIGVGGEGSELGDTPPVGESDRGDGERGVVAGLQVVSGPVEHREEGVVGVHGVVVGVTGDLVPRFEQRGHHELIGGEGARWHQLPHQVRRRRQRVPGAPPPQPVAVGHLADHDVSEQPGQRPAARPERIVVVHARAEPDPQDTDPVGAVEHRQPQHPAVALARPRGSPRAGRPGLRRCRRRPPGLPAVAAPGSASAVPGRPPAPPRSGRTAAPPGPSSPTAGRRSPRVTR